MRLNKNYTRLPFPFVLDELASIRPTLKRVFGFVYVYFDDRLLCGLRNSENQPNTNGIWLFTTSECVDSLMAEFPGLSKRQVWRSGKNAWIVLAARLAQFEEFALKACELMLNDDKRIGRIKRVRPRSKLQSNLNSSTSAP